MTRPAQVILDTLRGSMGLIVAAHQEEGPGCLVWVMTAFDGRHMHRAEDVDDYRCAVLLAESLGVDLEE